MQTHINFELHDYDLAYYAQLYFYDPKFTIKQRISKNPQLNSNLLHQLIDVLYSYNPFINIYQIVAEQI